MSRARFRRHESGNIALLTALMISFLVMLMAFGVDEASVYFDRRTLQGDTDVAAIVAANNLSKAQTAAVMSLHDNGAFLQSGTTHFDPEHASSGDAAAQVIVETGYYSADPTIEVAQRFNPGSGKPNAARVTVQKTAPLFFAAFFARSPIIETSAIAHTQALASFSLGSRLASLNGGVINGLLSGLLGSNVSLSLMDYNALLAARVDVLPMLDQLGLKLGVTAGTYDSLLQKSISYCDLADTLAALNGLPSTVVSPLRSLARQTEDSDATITLSKLMELGDLGKFAIGGSHQSVNMTVGVLDMLNAGAILGGKHQVQLNLGATIPGLAQTTADLSIGEPPQNSAWFTAGPEGIMVYTAQTRLRVNVQVGGTGLLAGLSVNLPVFLNLAPAQGTLKSVECAANGTASSATVGVQPGIAGAWIGNPSSTALTNMSDDVGISPASLIYSPFLKVTGSAAVTVGNQNTTNVSFSANDIARHAVKSASTSNFTNSLTSSLLGNLDLQVNTVGIGLNLGVVSVALKNLLQPLTPAVDQILYNTLALAGVRLGQADVWVNGVDCASAVLVQ